MSSQITFRDFRSPQDLAFYLDTAEQFQLGPLCRTYVDLTEELPKELQNLKQITQLFTDALSHSKNFLCHTTIKQLLTQYHTALIQTSKASEKFLEVSTEIVNGYNDMMRAVDKSQEKEALGRVKQSADKAIALFEPIIRPVGHLSAKDALVSTNTARQPSLQMLKTFKECQDRGATPDQIVIDAQARALGNIAILDQATKTLGKISTVLSSYQFFWNCVYLNADFISSSNGDIEALIECDENEEIRGTTQNASDRWLALARINQLVCKEIQPVLTELGKLIAPVEEKPSEGKA